MMATGSIIVQKSTELPLHGDASGVKVITNTPTTELIAGSIYKHYDIAGNYMGDHMYIGPSRVDGNPVFEVTEHIRDWFGENVSYSKKPDKRILLMYG